MSRILLLGGTGAMGVYLREILAGSGHYVIVTSRSHHEDSGSVRFVVGNAQDDAFVRDVVNDEKPDAIVDFMIYKTDQFRARVDWLLKSTKHYLFLSSYRVYADAKVITEESPRLLDVCEDEEYLKTDEYALLKARQENILTDCTSRNWTIIRPSITYSKERFQFGCLEANAVVHRALRGLPVVIPREVLERQTSLTWGRDVARMIAGLVLNVRAYGEAFTCATSEHHSWREVAEVYRRHIGLKIKVCSLYDYIRLLNAPYQTRYDRMFDRVIDNRKVLAVSGVSAESLASLEEGLGRELDAFKQNPHFGWIDERLNAQMDRLTHAWPSFRGKSIRENKNYLYLRYPWLVNSLPMRMVRCVKRFAKSNGNLKSSNH